MNNNQCPPYIKQVIDMDLLGIIKFSSSKSNQGKTNIFVVNEETSIFDCLRREKRKLRTLNKVSFYC